MITMHHLVFGESNIKPNTFIGGIGVSINTPQLLASKLGISISRIKAFRVVNNNLEFFLSGTNYTPPMQNLFRNNTEITYFETDLTFTSVGNEFVNCINFVRFKSSKLINAQYNVFRETNLQTLEGIWENLDLIGDGMFLALRPTALPDINSFDFPDTTELRFNYHFDNCPTHINTLNLNSVVKTSGVISRNTPNLKFYNLKKLKNTSNVSNTFSNIAVDSTINTNIHLLTSNNGNLDIALANRTQGSIVNFYDDNGNYVSTL